MASKRLELAYAQAVLCWKAAAAKHPEFIRGYLESAEALLKKKRYVTGDMFRAHCEERGVFRPKALHHNVWVSGVTILKSVGWVHPDAKVEPRNNHNHMDKVTLWRSTIYAGV